MQKLLRQIQIVDIQTVLPYEGSMSRNIISEPPASLVRNPFPVARLGERFLLLDETVLFESLKQSGLRHLPVQILDDNHVTVVDPKVALHDFTIEELKQVVSEYGLIEFAETDLARPGFMLVSFNFTDSEARSVYLKESDQPGCSAALTILINSVNEIGGYSQTDETISRSDTLVRQAKPTAVMTMPLFDLDLLKAAALSERPFPVNLITTRPSCRVFNLDFPLSVLRDRSSLEEKQSFVQELIHMRQRAQKIAMVEGLVYLLNR